MGYSIITLTDKSRPQCVALTAAQGWNPDERKWRLLFQIAQVYGVRADDGTLLGCVVLTRYGADLAAIGMMLVAPDRRGQGVGGALLRHVLGLVGAATVVLDATDEGRPVYARYGFVEVSRRHSFVGALQPPTAPPLSRPATAADLAGIIAVDGTVNGVDRGALLRHLPAFAVALRVIERAGKITGYAAAWDAARWMMIGPLIAASESDAQALVTDLVAAVGHRLPWRLDLDDRRRELSDWVAGHGAAASYQVRPMVRAGRGPRDPLAGDPRWYVPLMHSTG